MILSPVMKTLLKISLCIGMLFLGKAALAQDNSYDVFIPISKYISQGDADKLSAWFDDNLEVSVLSSSSNSSRNQARQIMKGFFETYTPRSYDISHKAGRPNMKYALGTLNAGGETFVVTVFVKYKKEEEGYKVQMIKIERSE